MWILETPEIHMTVLLFCNHLYTLTYYRINLNLDKVFYFKLEEINFKILTDSAFRRQTFLVKTNSTSHHRNRIFSLDGYRVVKSNESGRTCIESIFGMFVHRWRIFGRKLEEDESVAKYIVLGAVCLHNYIQLQSYDESLR
eukprot:NODE_1309_length_1378_cov_1.683346.p2 type:complete len:141 gc:universal NODE_1309_length_1378_cov_1.683346:571-149(-)